VPLANLVVLVPLWKSRSPAVLRPDRLLMAPWAVVAPVPPCPTDRAVVRPDRLVMSELAPEAAAPRLVLAPEAVVALVPPLPIGKVPDTSLPRAT